MPTKYPYGTSSRSQLSKEAPETLKAPERKSFVSDSTYKAASDKYSKYNRWDTDAPKKAMKPKDNQYKALVKKVNGGKPFYKGPKELSNLKQAGKKSTTVR